MPSSTTASVDTSIKSRYSPAMGDNDEQALLERIRKGDSFGFELLVKEHTSKILGLAWRLTGNREDAEELVQEAFLRLHKSLPTFRGDSLIGTWLYRTTTHLAIDYLRRERIKRKLFFFRHDNDSVDLIDQATDTRLDPQRELLNQESLTVLRKSLSKLSARQQVIFTLRHYEGLSLKEIASYLDIKAGTVKSHLHRAVTQIRLDLVEYRERS